MRRLEYLLSLWAFGEQEMESQKSAIEASQVWHENGIFVLRTSGARIVRGRREDALYTSGRKSMENDEGRSMMKDKGTFGGIYGMAFIGAAVYFISHATGFWNGVWGFIKALFWPAVLMYELLSAIS